jgi:hypothetical protein
LEFANAPQQESEVEPREVLTKLVRRGRGCIARNCDALAQ